MNEKVIRLTFPPQEIQAYLTRWKKHLKATEPKNLQLQAMAQDIETLVDLAVKSLNPVPENKPL